MPNVLPVRNSRMKSTAYLAPTCAAAARVPAVALKLTLAADERINMFARAYALKLCTDRFGNRVERFAGRVGNEVQMIFTAHDSSQNNPQFASSSAYDTGNHE